MFSSSPFIEPARRVPVWLNLVGFQGLWWLTILTVAEGQVWIGPIAVLALAALQIALLPDRGAELRAWLLVALPGFLLDSALAAGGAFGFPQDPWLLGVLPPWMAALWLSFAMTVRHGLAWLHGRPVLAAAFGLLGGPATYLAGSKFSALSIETPQALWLSALGSTWGLACSLWFLRPLGKAVRAGAAAELALRGSKG